MRRASTTTSATRSRSSPISGGAALVRYLEPGFRQDLVGARAEIDRQLSAIVDGLMATELRPAARLKRFVALRRLRNLAGVGTTPPTQASADLELFRRVLHQGRLDVEAWGGRLDGVAALASRAAG